MLLLLLLLQQELTPVVDAGCVQYAGPPAMLANWRMLIAVQSVNTDHVNSICTRDARLTGRRADVQSGRVCS